MASKKQIQAMTTSELRTVVETQTIPDNVNRATEWHARRAGWAAAELQRREMVSAGTHSGARRST